MDNQKFVQIHEILSAIKAHLDEGGVLHAGALILSDEETIQDAVSEVLEGMNEPHVPIIPRSQRRRLNTYMGRTSGWIGKRKIRYFDNEEEARAWLNSSEQ